MRAKPFSAMHSHYRWNRTAQTGLAVAVAILFLGGLAACNSSSARPPSVSTRNVAGGQPAATAASASPSESQHTANRDAQSGRPASAFQRPVFRWHLRRHSACRNYLRQY